MVGTENKKLLCSHIYTHTLPRGAIATLYTQNKTGVLIFYTFMDQTDVETKGN